ncbi:UDP-N-acetylmuramate dehydrogenase [Acetobacteraceae bacterium]|nr:UDP-N-acetylmuramate dehydrogenase [Acetobacteraceae bacterium]
MSGKIIENFPLGKRSWFATGGNAEKLFVPETLENLQEYLSSTSQPPIILGALSNTLIRDGGIKETVIRLGGDFRSYSFEEESIIVGAACLDMTLATAAAAEQRTGLEFLSGIPGSLGGAIAMNSGAFGSEIANILDWVEVVLPTGESLRLLAHEIGLSYRSSKLPEGAIVTKMRLHAPRGNPEEISEKMKEIKLHRKTAQPTKVKTGGSTFRNPEGHSAWKLIDDAGCRGKRRGGAMISEKHCNFLINLGDATAQDLEFLGDEVQDLVKKQSGILLHWEIKRIGQR